MTRAEQIRQILAENPTIGTREIAKRLGVSRSSVRVVMGRSKLSTSKTNAPVDVEEPKDVLLQRELQRAENALRKQSVDSAWEERAVSEFSSALKQSLSSISGVVTSKPAILKRSKVSHAETALLCLSDTHIGKRVTRESTMWLGLYNNDVFLDRLHHLEHSVIHLIRDELRAPVSQIYIALMGDLVEGALDHSSEKAERDLVAEQCVFAGNMLYQMIRNLSFFRPIKVVGAAVGNHGRLPNQRKMPTEGRHSNFDWIVMGMIESLCRETLKNVEFVMHRSPFWVDEINGWRFMFGHGDHLRGGDKAMGVPSHAIARQINATTQRFSARGERPPDYYVVGDKHRPISLPTATGRFLVNGAWFEDDTYALVSNFPPARPHQIFFGVHPKVGRSWSYDVALDLATQGHDYVVPQHLAHLVGGQTTNKDIK